jgi:ABC-2 type transport system ATP-binding protein
VRRIFVVLGALAGLLTTVIPLAAKADDLPYSAAERGSITSFDGTKIVYNFFLPKAPGPVPVIMRTHGWGGSGEQASGLSSTSKATLAAGYALLTWDERGFGQSGGDAWVDHPDYEVRDAQALIDWLAKRPEIRKNGPNDPVIGMTGGSYAGGIQLALAAFDSRVDAIAPEITWNDLRRSLFPGDVIKLGWGELLYGSGLATSTTGGLSATPPETGSYAPFIHEAQLSGLALGYPSDQTKENFRRQGLSDYSKDHAVRAPTLLIQGNTDTLFDLNEAWANFKAVRAEKKLLIYCDGHAGCPSTNADKATARSEADKAIVNWFARYLKDQDVDTGGTVHYSLKDGTWHDTGTFPTVDHPGAATFGDSSGKGMIVNPGAPNPGENSGQAYGVAVTDTSTAGEPGTMRVQVLDAAATARQIVGIGHVHGVLTGPGTGTNLIFKLVDREDAKVVNYQAATLRIDRTLALPMDTRAFDVDLVGVAELLPAGHHLDLEVSTTGLAHTTFRGAGVFTLDLDHIRVPVLSQQEEHQD